MLCRGRNGREGELRGWRWYNQQLLGLGCKYGATEEEETISNAFYTIPLHSPLIVQQPAQA
jgi:hypothetical protein